MELLETLIKFVVLLVFYVFMLIAGGMIACFFVVVAFGYWISGIFYTSKEIEDHLEIRTEQRVYAHDTLVIYKKEEYAVTIMYELSGRNNSEIDILSITNAQEDFTEKLSEYEIARLTAEIEFNHVN